MSTLCEVGRCSRCAMSREYRDQPVLSDPLPVGIEAAAGELRRLGVPLVAFGQTLFWDEASKAVLRRLLDEHAPEVLLFAGIHDSDYFSKLHGRGRAGEGFVRWATNDWTHRSLWAAVAETTSLFGAETPPGVAELQAAGVPLRLLAALSSDEMDDFLDSATAAYGWRGVAQLGATNQIARDVRVAEAGEALCELLEWGLRETLGLLAERGARRAAETKAEALLHRLRAAIAEMQHTTVSELYRRLIAQFYADLLGYESDRIIPTTTCEYLAFNRETCMRARFQPVQAFLCHRVGICARETYNDAVAGQGMYGLDEFGEGAVPFDLIVPGRGRGTLRVLDREVRAEFSREPLSIPTDERVCFIEDLAALVEEAVGTKAAIAGKALLGPVMFCGEAILVLHEGASAYVPRTRLWLSRLNSSCGSLRTYPILRLRQHAYDALSAAQATLRLPQHLAAAFDKPQISAAEFGRRWQSVIQEQECLLKRLAQARSVSALLAIIAEQNGGVWRDVAAELVAARELLSEAGAQIRARLGRLAEIRSAERRARRRRAEVEQRSGELRAREQEGGDPEAREALRQLLGVMSEEIRLRESRRAELRQEIADLAHSPPVQAARKRIAEIAAQAERERLALARRALLVRHMEIGDRRPTSWWFGVVDPSGAWFEEAVRRADVYLQDLSSPPDNNSVGH
ncbi:MAG: hypothetical protein FJX75_10505 [Armatimonadetes bacterium]|nr:hypothetical protein [Armatimonadota bacterium]